MLERWSEKLTRCSIYRSTFLNVEILRDLNFKHCFPYYQWIRV